MNEQNYYRISVKALVLNETGRFLLSREDNGMWELLGGGLDHGEDPVACLKREINEETGLVVTDISPTPKYFVTSPRMDSDRFIANIIYEVKLQDLDFTASDECQELRFCNIEEAGKLDLFPNVTNFLKIYDPALHLSISPLLAFFSVLVYNQCFKRLGGDVGVCSRTKAPSSTGYRRFSAASSPPPAYRYLRS